MKLRQYFISLLLVLSCTPDYDKLKGRTISQEGNYNYNDSLYLRVDVKDDLVSYSVKDYSGEVLIDMPNEFSNLHRWILYIDKSQSIWVLSSDLGHSLWKRNDSDHAYEQVNFSNYLEKEDVPNYLYNDLKDFFD